MVARGEAFDITTTEVNGQNRDPVVHLGTEAELGHVVPQSVFAFVNHYQHGRYQSHVEDYLDAVFAYRQEVGEVAPA